MYYTYMLRCKDNSIYTGITTNLERRLQEHCAKNEKTAKYTLNHLPINFEVAWESENRSLASKLEYNLKKLTKAQKESIIENAGHLSEMLGNKLNCKEYKRIELKSEA